MSGSWGLRLSVLLLPIAGMITACQPGAKSSALEANGPGIVNGTDATSSDVAAKGLAESVVIVIATLYTPDHKTETGIAICTGTLIAPQIVLTAAHCVADSGILPSDVQVGLHFTNVPAQAAPGVAHPGATGYTVKAFTVNPGYQPNNQNASQNSDMAMILLSTPVPAGTRVATLPAANFDFTAITALMPIGYGQSNEKQNAPQDQDGTGVLRYTSFPQGKFEVLPSDGSVPASFQGMIAAQADTTSVCHGDSGGPLMAVNSAGSENVIVGINDAVLPQYQGQEQTDYLAAEQAGSLTPFYAKYPDANICSGGLNVFVNVTLQLNWINTTKTALLAQLGH